MIRQLVLFIGSLFAGFLLLPTLSVLGQESQQAFIPRRQSAPPGPPLAPADAIAKMTVPEGFHVELVASEPQLVNPVSMAFDDRGRIYVTESFEYPRLSAGPGKDRIKILEDTDADGRMDRVTIFAEGLNIPSGIAVGHGGVWVANSPDLLFLKDTDGDDRADVTEVVVTGFGRADTHELPNALTWGPDGWLYGLNGVFNPSHIKQGNQTFDFTCAMFRIDPKTRKFEVFCEGTSNPWGIAFNAEGSAFISACVIDHLWHLTETGYYHRQGGPYPPFTWKMDSIVNYTHQMAAYCGIEYLDTPAYPESYRQKLVMGNIHGGCLNVDRVERQGSTYRGHKDEDLLTANDVWFMPVAQKVGPDGCLYILDWYDRYHCYQDANADPEGIDRGHGRLYRLVHKQRPAIEVSDMSRCDLPTLISLLSHRNVFVRNQSQLELAERSDPQAIPMLMESINNSSQPIEYRLRAIWSIIAMKQVTVDMVRQWLTSSEPEIQAWGIRALGHQPHLAKEASIEAELHPLRSHTDPRVRLELAIAMPKVYPENAASWSVLSARHNQGDSHISKILWQGMLPHMIARHSMIAQSLVDPATSTTSSLYEMAPRLVDRWISEVAGTQDVAIRDQLAQSLTLVIQDIHKRNPSMNGEVYQRLVERIHNRELSFDKYPWLRTWNLAPLDQALPSQIQFAAFAGDTKAIGRLVTGIQGSQVPAPTQVSYVQSLVLCSPKEFNDLASLVLADLPRSNLQAPVRDAILGHIIRSGTEAHRQKLLASLPQLPQAIQATFADRFCQQEGTSIEFLQAIERNQLHKELIGPERVRLLSKSNNGSIQGLVKKNWGDVRLEVSPDRQQVIRKQHDFLHGSRGNAEAGWKVYDRTCGQCHVLHGRGQEVGPNITRNGRGTFEQLLSSVFDPNLVIGEAYRGVTVATQDGQVLQGLLVERTENQIKLKLQGGKVETVPMSEVSQWKQSDKSLMPEGLEQQIRGQELVDLFALLCLELEPSADGNATIPGTPPNLTAPKK